MAYCAGDLVDALFCQVTLAFYYIVEEGGRIDAGFVGEIAVGEIAFRGLLIVVIIAKVGSEILVFENIDHDTLVCVDGRHPVNKI